MGGELEIRVKREEGGGFTIVSAFAGQFPRTAVSRFEEVLPVLRRAFGEAEVSTPLQEYRQLMEKLSAPSEPEPQPAPRLFRKGDRVLYMGMHPEWSGRHFIVGLDQGEGYPLVQTSAGEWLMASYLALLPPPSEDQP